MFEESLKDRTGLSDTRSFNRSTTMKDDVIMDLRKVLHRKLLIRVTMPAIMGIFMLIGILLDYVYYVRFPPITFALVFLGLAMGYPFGRLTKIAWNSDRTQLVLDSGQGAILAAYFIVRVVSDVIIHVEFGALVFGFDVIFLVAAGSVLGRSLGTLRQIRIALKSGFEVSNKETK